MSLFAGVEYCSKNVSILWLIKHDHIDDISRSWLLLISWEGYAKLACVASVSNRVIIALELQEMEDARKHLLRRPSLGVRGEKMGGGGGAGKEVFSPFSLSLFGSQLPSLPQKRLILSLTLHQQSQYVNCVTIYTVVVSCVYVRLAWDRPSSVKQWLFPEHLKDLAWKKLRKKRRNGEEEIWGR